MLALKYRISRIALQPLFWALFISAAAHLAFWGSMGAEKAEGAERPVTARLIPPQMRKSNVSDSVSPASDHADTLALQHISEGVETAPTSSSEQHEMPSENGSISIDSASMKYYKVSYPYLSRKLGEEGDVTVSAVITEAGIAEDVEVVESSGYKRLDNAVRAGVEKAVFIPKKINGEAVSSVVLLGPFKFRLTSEVVEKY